MAFKHPTDPPTQWGAAEKAGKLVAQGLLTVEDFLPQLMEAAIKQGFDGDLRGTQSRLAWHMRDVALMWEGRRSECDRRIKREIAPLIEGWAAAEDILALAHSINEDADEPLLRSEVKRTVAGELAFFLRNVRRRRRV